MTKTNVPQTQVTTNAIDMARVQKVVVMTIEVSNLADSGCFPCCWYQMADKLDKLVELGIISERECKLAQTLYIGRQDSEKYGCSCNNVDAMASWLNATFSTWVAMELIGAGFTSAMASEAFDIEEQTTRWIKKSTACYSSSLIDERVQRVIDQHVLVTR